MKETAEKIAEKIKDIKADSYDAWVEIQIANKKIEDMRAKMMKNAQMIATLEQSKTTEKVTENAE